MFSSELRKRLVYDFRYIPYDNLVSTLYLKLCEISWAEGEDAWVLVTAFYIFGRKLQLTKKYRIVRYECVILPELYELKKCVKNDTLSVKNY